MRYRRSPQEELNELPSVPQRVFKAPIKHFNPLALERQGGPYQPADLPVAASSYGKHPRGKVGPVYTFVKTDPDANFKWGVRHVAGAQYGR